MLRSSSLSGRLYTNLEISLPGRELEEYTPVNLSHSLPLTAGHRRTADQPNRTAPQMLPHLQQPSCEIKLPQNYIIGLTYLDRHERLDESLFVHQSEVDQEEIQDREVGRSDNRLITSVELQL